MTSDLALHLTQVMIVASSHSDCNYAIFSILDFGWIPRQSEIGPWFMGCVCDHVVAKGWSSGRKGVWWILEGCGQVHTKGIWLSGSIVVRSKWFGRGVVRWTLIGVVKWTFKGCGQVVPKGCGQVDTIGEGVWSRGWGCIALRTHSPAISAYVLSVALCWGAAPRAINAFCTSSHHSINRSTSDPIPTRAYPTPYLCDMLCVSASVARCTQTCVFRSSLSGEEVTTSEKGATQACTTRYFCVASQCIISRLANSLAHRTSESVFTGAAQV